MIPLSILLAAAVLTMTLFPETGVARTLRIWLIGRPAVALSRFGAGRMIVLSLLALIAIGMFWLGEAEGLRLFAMGAPEAFAWMAMFDAGAVIDLVVVAVIAQGATRLAPMRERLQRTLNGLVAVTVRPARRAGRAVRSAVRRRLTGRRDDAEPRFAFGAQPAFG